MPKTTSHQVKDNLINNTAVDPALSLPVTVKNSVIDITPSYFSKRENKKPVYAENSNSDPRLRLRGTVIHKMLELLTSLPDREEVKQQTETLYLKAIGGSFFNDCWREAQSLVDNEEFSYLFQAARFDTAYNEVAIQFMHLNYCVNGIIDRLILSKNTAYLIDYKTNVSINESTLSAQSDTYRRQMSIYYHGVRKLWPEKSIETNILFTHQQKIVEIVPVALDKLFDDI